MRPLSGVTVVTLEHAIAAPFATRQLADLGARVIKIERPGVGDFARGYDERVRGLASHFIWVNRSKESLTLDVKQPEAQALLHRLVLERADVVVQNLAPGAKFCTKTSDRSTRRARTSRASGLFTSSVSDSFDRFNQTKWLARPRTVVSYPRAKSPATGRSILMTRAPRSASCRVANGTATACSSASTVIPASGCSLLIDARR